MNKQNQKALDKAAFHGHGSLLRTIALIHRCSSKRTQNELEALIEAANAWGSFSWVNGALLHSSEQMETMA